jgi:monoamine oxidase
MGEGAYSPAHTTGAGRPVISFFKAGSYSHPFEDMDENILPGRIVEDMSATGLFPDLEKNLDGPMRFSAWGKNPFTLGSYSYCRPGFTRPDNFQSGRIVFAGEAFHASPEKSPGQIVGAWYSGVIAASMIVG